jgi:hypothetical protein
VTHTIVRGQRLGACASDVARAEDRNSRHEPVGYSTGSGDTHG